MTSICFRIPASMTDGFLGQVAMFRRSLDVLGGPYRAAEVVAYIGSDTHQPLPERWRLHFERISVRPVPTRPDSPPWYYPQTIARWQDPPSADVTIMSDADTMVVAPFDEVVDDLARSPAIAGSIAHFPVPQQPGTRPPDAWSALSGRFLDGELPMTHRHTLVPESAPEWQRLGPFYLNFGFVGVSSALVIPIGVLFADFALQISDGLLRPEFSGQVALTLAVYKLGVDRREIDIRYNFPNDPNAERLHPESSHDVRVVHYLRTTSFDRQRIFADAAAFDSFLGLELGGVDAQFQEHVRTLTDGHYPFA